MCEGCLVERGFLLHSYFPVIGQYYYQSLVGLALNQFVAHWSMLPPLFALPTRAT